MGQLNQIGGSSSWSWEKMDSTYKWQEKVSMKGQLIQLNLLNPLTKTELCHVQTLTSWKKQNLKLIEFISIPIIGLNTTTTRSWDIHRIYRRHTWTKNWLPSIHEFFLVGKISSKRRQNSSWYISRLIDIYSLPSYIPLE